MLSLPSESARSSTGRSRPLAAKDTQVMGWPWAASGGAPAARAAVSFFSRSPQARPSILIDTSGCVFSYAAAISLRTARVWGSVSVCQSRTTFLSAALTLAAVSRNALRRANAVARLHVIVSSFDYIPEIPPLRSSQVSLSPLGRGQGEGAVPASPATAG